MCAERWPPAGPALTEAEGRLRQGRSRIAGAGRGRRRIHILGQQRHHGQRLDRLVWLLLLRVWLLVWLLLRFWLLHLLLGLLHLLPLGPWPLGCRLLSCWLCCVLRRLHLGRGRLQLLGGGRVLRGDLLQRFGRRQRALEAGCHGQLLRLGIRQRHQRHQR